MPRAIGTLGTIDTLTVAGRTFTDLGNLITLGGTIPASPNVFIGLSLTQTASPSNYQVTTGKTLTIGAIRGFSLSTSANPFGQVGYGDTSTSTSGAATPPTGAIYSWSGYAHPGTATGEIFETGLDFDVPAQKYPFAIAAAGNVQLAVFGYEA